MAPNEILAYIVVVSAGLSNVLLLAVLRSLRDIARTEYERAESWRRRVDDVLALFEDYRLNIVPSYESFAATARDELREAKAAAKQYQTDLAVCRIELAEARRSLTQTAPFNSRIVEFNRHYSDHAGSVRSFID